MIGDLAILFLTHQWDPVHARRFHRLREETDGLADCRVLYQRNGAGMEPAEATGERVHAFDPDSLPSRLGYAYLRGQGIVPGCAHYPLVDFARQYAYRHYWLIENDVEFSGNWRELIGAFSQDNADLVAAHLRRFEADPRWYWWPSLRAPLRRPLNAAKALRAFFPVFRISRQALLFVDRMQRDGWRGHCEALLPTLIHAAGMSIRDLRHYAPFYRGSRQEPPRNAEQLSQLSTLRWRPPITQQEFLRRFGENVIFHPVKAAWTFNGKGLDLFAAPPTAAND